MIHLTRHTFVQPTLSLNFGGTGVKCGGFLAKMLDSLAPAEGELIEVFYFDSQEPEARDHHRARHYCYPDLNVFETPVYREFEAMRFPENRGRNPVVSSCDGSGVTRIFGTASLVACRDDFLTLLRRAVIRLKRKRASPTQPIQVFLTASSCGGTGAGMILDAAALVRHLFREEFGENPKIYLFLVGPDVFAEDASTHVSSAQQRRMKASTYALLKELHHFAQGKPFVSAYRLRDQVVKVSNASDDDRLFDWVYFVDGKPSGGLAAKSLDELLWIVAEAQLHLAATEVGRKVTESMPNQREERVRLHPANSIHPDQRLSMTEELREQLEASSRITFLASLSVRNVRFPAPEIARRFRCGWVREALEKALLRDGDGQADDFDRALGYDGQTVGPDGKLADLGLSEEALVEFVRRSSLEGRGGDGIPGTAFKKSVSPGRLVRDGRSFLEHVGRLLRGLEGGAGQSDDAATGDSAGGSLPHGDRAVDRWNHEWEDRFPETIQSLRAVALDAAEGRGLRWLNQFLLHTEKVLLELSARHRPRRQVGELRRALAEAKESVDRVGKLVGKERSTIAFRARSLVNKGLMRRTGAFGTRTLRSVGPSVTLLNQLREELSAEMGRREVDELVSSVYRRVALDLERWRQVELMPLVTAVENAAAVARDREEHARLALATYRGGEGAGEWVSGSTTQLSDPELMKALEARVARDPYSVEGSILGALLGQGFAFGRDRLSLATLPGLAPETVVDLVTRRVESETTRILAFLDRGWLLEEAREVAPKAAAEILDAGSEPLTSFDRQSLGLEIQGYLLTPPGLVLPEVFGRTASSLTRLQGRDPLRISVISLVYGIAPNALGSILDLYANYRIHVGDLERLEAHDRYPLHVFRQALETFEEPYSPTELHFTEESVANLTEVARKLELIDGEGRLRLTLREGRPSVAGRDLLVELCEEVLWRATSSQEVADEVFQGQDLGGLEDLFDQRTHRYTAYGRARSPLHIV